MDVFTLTFSYIFILILAIRKIIKDIFILHCISVILKFTLNTIICCLLCVVLLWKLEVLYVGTMSYGLVTITLIDIVFFYIEKHNYNLGSDLYVRTAPEIVLAFICLVMNCVIIGISIYLNYSKQKEINLTLIVGEGEFYISHVMASFITRVKHLYSMYYILIGVFAVSYFIELLFHFIWVACDNYGWDCFYISMIGFIFIYLLPHVYIYLAVLKFKWK